MFIFQSNNENIISFTKYEYIDKLEIHKTESGVMKKYFRFNCYSAQTYQIVLTIFLTFLQFTFRIMGLKMTLILPDQVTNYCISKCLSK